MIRVEVNRTGTEESYEITEHKKWIVALFNLFSYLLILTAVVLIGMHFALAAAISGLASLLFHSQARAYKRENLLLQFISDIFDAYGDKFEKEDKE